MPISKINYNFVLEFCGFPCFLDVGKGRRLPYVAPPICRGGVGWVVAKSFVTVLKRNCNNGNWV